MTINGKKVTIFVPLQKTTLLAIYYNCLINHIIYIFAVLARILKYLLYTVKIFYIFRNTFFDLKFYLKVFSCVRTFFQTGAKIINKMRNAPCENIGIFSSRVFILRQANPSTQLISLLA